MIEPGETSLLRHKVEAFSSKFSIFKFFPALHTGLAGRQEVAIKSLV